MNMSSDEEHQCAEIAPISLENVTVRKTKKKYLVSEQTEIQSYEQLSIIEDIVPCPVQQSIISEQELETQAVNSPEVSMVGYQLNMAEAKQKTGEPSQEERESSIDLHSKLSEEEEEVKVDIDQNDQEGRSKPSRLFQDDEYDPGMSYFAD